MFSVLTTKVNKSLAFTLAEVLITLGIIGVVAALTIPSLQADIIKKKTETKVVKFYSMMNQALKLSISENGDFSTLVTHTNSYEENLEIAKTYFFPYLTVNEYYSCTSSLTADNPICMKLSDGTLFAFDISSAGGNIQLLLDKNALEHPTTQNRFAFQIAKYTTYPLEKMVDSDVMNPYIYGWNGNTTSLKTNSRYGCNKSSTLKNYCTKLLQMNNWKFPKDYPW